MAQFSIIKPGTKIKFVEHHKPVMWTIFALCIVGIIGACSFMSPNWGTSFQGGTSLMFHFDQPVQLDAVRSAFEEDARFDSVHVQTVGDDTKSSFVVRTRTTASITCDNFQNVKSNFNAKLQSASGNPNISSVEASWPSCDGDGIRGTFDIAIKNNEDVTVSDLDTNIVKTAMINAGFANIDVEFNEVRSQYTIRPQGVQADALDLLNTRFAKEFNDKTGLDSVSTVGADVGEKFRNDAIVSIFIALCMMLLYIGIRFDTRYAPAAVISLTATTLLTFAFIVFLQIEITLETVAAMLSLVGYGINDTIVNFDRVRENVAICDKNMPLDDIVNKSINECISRTVVTSITTLVAIIPLIIFSTGTTSDFAKIMTFGICVATLNSMFISCPFVIKFDKLFKNYKAKAEAAKAIENDIAAEANEPEVC